MTVKEPGLEMKTRVSNLNASFRNEDEQPSDAYEDLLLDVIEGDRSLFYVMTKLSMRGKL